MIEVKVTVVAMDGERGVKATREQIVEVPGKVTKLHEMLGGDEDEVLRRIGDTVFAAALREVQASRVDVSQALVSAGGGRIGGRGRNDPAPVTEEAAAPRQSPADDLGSMLGLDLIRNQVKREQSAPRQAGPAPRQPSRQPMGPGPVGFPKR